MKIKSFVLALILMAMVVFMLAAQGGAVPSDALQAATATRTPAPTARPTSRATAVPSNANSVQIFFVACQSSAIVNLSGNMLANWDVYYQVFSGAGGGGTALTSLRQVQVSGNYRFSENIAYNTGSTVGTGTIASVKVLIARETDATRVDFQTTVDDLQDGCNTAQNPTGSSIDTGTGTSAAGGASGPTYFILAPGSGVLNPNYTPEDAVVVGARQSLTFRSQTPGLIFAECDAYPQAFPGIVYDNDNVTVFWSWFTKTQQEAEDHAANALYSVKMNGNIFPNVVRSDPTLRQGQYWIFYSAYVGHLQPGHYEIEYKLSWSHLVNDGYHDYGPGTSNPQVLNLCNFNVFLNPDHASVSYNGLYHSTAYPVHDLFPSR